jgi:hypothetical protein
LRSDVIWSKPNAMPESVTDRPTRAHEYLFLLSKSARYHYDADAIREEASESSGGWQSRDRRGEKRPDAARAVGPQDRNGASQWERDEPWIANLAGRNRRSVWTVATQPYAGAHFATFPAKLIEPCILAGTSPRACRECGAPWRRVTDRALVPTPKAVRNAVVDARDAEGAAGGDQGSRRQRDGHLNGYITDVTTVGWEPSCDHDDDSGRCVVLDPFAGAGTAGVVAGQLGRDFIGVELNPEYAAMARDRITREGRPGDREHRPHKPITGQGTLDLLESAEER